MKRKLGTTTLENWGEDEPGRSYHRFLVALVMICSGGALLLEHLLTWGRFDPSFGHEWIGILLIIIGMGIGVRKNDQHR